MADASHEQYTNGSEPQEVAATIDPIDVVDEADRTVGAELEAVQENSDELAAVPTILIRRTSGGGSSVPSSAVDSFHITRGMSGRSIISDLARRGSDAPRFEALRGTWRYGQPVFARYKKTPCFYSGNIATYLGAGLFMVIFDDGTLNYRVKREDIVVLEEPRDSVEEDIEALVSSVDESSDQILLKARASPSYEAMNRLRDPHASDTWTQTMVDFSMTPPRYVTIREELANVVLVPDETIAMKHLECGVAYDDDSTQVSDSDDSSEEDMTMTPWQQMTQTFGMGKIRPRAQRRSSSSSISERQQNIPQMIPSPKGFKATITEYLSRKTRKVQPAAVGSNVATLEHIRQMEGKLMNLRAQHSKEPPTTSRVVYERASDGIRAYGTINNRLEDGAKFEIIAEEDQMLTVKVLPVSEIDFLPSIKELEHQLADLKRQITPLYAGCKVQVNLYPGSRFSGQGVITLANETQTMYTVLLRNRIRLVNVPMDKLTPVQTKKKQAVYITEDQFLICANKACVFIGDQIFVRCEGDDEGVMEDKLGILNGVYSNCTAAVDFADGSTGYEIPPLLIQKRKRAHNSAGVDVMSLKNAVLMQVAGSVAEMEQLEVGYQVKADHPSKATVESCMIIKKHDSSACDLRFSDGTIAFEVYPSQMIVDRGGTNSRKRQALLEFQNDTYVLGWSSRFGRYCSARIVAKSSEGVSAMYSLVFDYGEQKKNVPAEKIALLDDSDALSPTQKLTNYSIDTIGFEIRPVTFTVGEAVMARIYGSVQYFYGWVEGVLEKDRMCVVQFDSSERDKLVPFSSMFSVDVRNRFQSVSNKMDSSSGGGADSDRVAVTEESSASPAFLDRRRRHSSGSMGSMIMSVAGSIFRARKHAERDERRGSHLVTEIGAHLRHLANTPTPEQ